MPTPTACIVLAAGQGTRMRSGLPKVLHPLCDEPMVVHVVRVALAVRADPIVVVVSPTNHAAIEAALTAAGHKEHVRFAVQAEPRGTGDAARAGMQELQGAHGQVLVLYGDVPCLRPSTLEALLAARAGEPMSVLGAKVADATGYGRLLRTGQGANASLARIVEHKDCSPEQLAIDEINSGIYAIDVAFLRQALPKLAPNNAQRELYLTDVVAMAAQAGRVAVQLLDDVDEARGVNSRVDLGEVEMYLRRRLVRAHQERGVTFVAPESVRLAPTVALGRDVTIGMGVQLLGQCTVGDGATIDGPSVVKDCTLAAGAHVLAFSHCERAEVGEGAHVGPYGRLRPGARIGAGARVGNFVEVKNSTFEAGAKANHLAYIGDATVAEKANVGAGTITCNYDGFHKHKTRIGKGAFVGSNSTLVAPIDIGAGAITAAGSTLTDDVPKDAVAFGRARQHNLPERAPALREKLA